MDIILLERVPNLGQMGDIVSVKPGFARNFLLPRKKALRATEANKKAFEERRKDIEAANLERRKEAEAVAGKMEGARVSLIRQAGESGQLYGSVRSHDIVDSLKEQGFTVERGQVVLAAPIKTLGLFDVTLQLHPEVAISVKANVARSEHEAEEQWKLGGALIGSPEEREDAAAEAEEAEIDTEQLVAELMEEKEQAEEAIQEAREAQEELAESVSGSESGEETGDSTDEDDKTA